MQLPSLTTILGIAFLGYIGHSIYSIALLFKAPTKCTGTPCYRSYFSKKPTMQLLLFTAPTANPVSGDVTNVLTIRKFNYNEPYDAEIGIKVPLKTRRNGTLFMHAVLAVDDGKEVEWKQLQRDGPTVIYRIALTDYMLPQAATFNLLGDAEATQKASKEPQKKPVTHIKKKIYLTILSDPTIEMAQEDIVPEIARHVRVSHKHEFLPIVQSDFLKNRIHDYEEVTKEMTNTTLAFNYAPITFGKLRFMIQIEFAMKNLIQMGFTAKDVDEVKSIFSDTNVYLLSATIFIAGIHLLFDFLSFKNDVLFWKRKKSYVGLSVRTTLWRAFSQIVIFLYLMDENTSLLVLIPAGIGTLIELWKSKKILKLDVSFSGIKFKSAEDEKTPDESYTRQVDREAMTYLSYLLYPLCIAGAVYSLIYQPHKSWYSWTINSLVNGVYAFGFLFMLPQLFINYKLKSVAALPWRAFMYKAFNTFIDDIFAFIITMPTAHRVACFRDDIVFLIYLYQRWLYPVDNTRLDNGATETAELEEEKKKN